MLFIKDDLFRVRNIENFAMFVEKGGSRSIFTKDLFLLMGLPLHAEIVCLPMEKTAIGPRTPREEGLKDKLA